MARHAEKAIAAENGVVAAGEGVVAAYQVALGVARQDRQDQHHESRCRLQARKAQSDTPQGTGFEEHVVVVAAAVTAEGHQVALGVACQDRQEQHHR